MIRWLFFFDEGNIKSDVTLDAEDQRIAAFVASNGQGLLALPGDPRDIYVNLGRVKCVVREVVDEAAEALAAAQAPGVTGAESAPVEDVVETQ